MRIGLCLALWCAAASAQMRPARLVPLPLTAVRVNDRFWSARIAVNRAKSLEAVRRKLIDTGAIQNLAIAAGKARGEYRGPFWSDSDVYKWLEGVSYSLAFERDRALEAEADDVIALIAAAQEKDGYLDTYFQLVEKDGRWANLAFGHEDFNAGHLLEAAVAHWEATGKRTLLDVAIRNADCFERTFGPGKREGQPGHEGLELALVKLARATGDQRYTRLAQFFIDSRGQRPSVFEREYQKLDPAKIVNFLGRQISIRKLADDHFRHDPSKFDTQYSQDHLPVRQQDKVVGHAVRAMYLYSGIADVASETGDESLHKALQSLYRDMTTKRMYVTGGVGPSARNEGFTFDYDLPNETAYQETCASIGVAMWTQRMLGLTGDARYADIMEVALFNAVPAGVALAGDTFFYTNVLASAGRTERRSWFSVPCCPTNIVRTLPSIGKYIYSQSSEGLWVNTYIRSEAAARFAGGGRLAVVQSSDYPWSGDVTLRITEAEAAERLIALRIPGWAGRAGIRLNGRPVAPTIENGYAHLKRRWTVGDTIELKLPMDVQRIESHPSVAGNRGRLALQRGPIIYCVEQADHAIDIERLFLPAAARLEAKAEPGLLGGVTVLTGQAMLTPNSWNGSLYRLAQSKLEGPVTLRAVPYSVWANRGHGKMAVWIEGSRY